MSEPVGTLCIVLHTHLPWLPRHGSWPVGEEWLHQAWSGSYLPLLAVLDRMAAEGRRDLLTLGVTPVLAAALDDPYALREHHGWLGRWQTASRRSMFNSSTRNLSARPWSSSSGGSRAPDSIKAHASCAAQVLVSGPR